MLPAELRRVDGILDLLAEAIAREITNESAPRPAGQRGAKDSDERDDATRAREARQSTE